MRLSIEIDTQTDSPECVNAVLQLVTTYRKAPDVHIDEQTHPRAQHAAITHEDFPREEMRDKTGVLYDERIHSVPAKINSDGHWRRRRSVEDEQFHKVMAELSVHPKEGRSSTPPPPPPPPQLKYGTTPVALNEFTAMMLQVSDLLMKGQITHENIEYFARSINAVVNGKGMIGKLKDSPELIPLFLNLVQDHVNKTTA